MLICAYVNIFVKIPLNDYNIVMETNEKSPLDKRALKVKEELIDEEKLDDITLFFKTMGDNTRLNILMALNHNEFCVGDLTYILGLSQSAISHALQTLRSKKLVKTRREGKTIYYSLDDDHVTSILDMAIAHLSEKH